MSIAILILAGGFSKEREISIITAKAVNKELSHLYELEKIYITDSTL